MKIKPLVLGNKTGIKLKQYTILMNVNLNFNWDKHLPLIVKSKDKVEPLFNKSLD